MDRETLGAIAMMINSFPQSQSTDMQTLLMGYKMALDGLRNDAVVQVCRMFMRGVVPDQDRRFAPSVAQFAVEAQKQHDYLNLVDLRAKTPAIESKPSPETIITDAEREKMKPKIAEIMRGYLKSLISFEQPEPEYVHDSSRPTDHLVAALESKASPKSDRNNGEIEVAS